AQQQALDASGQRQLDDYIRHLQSDKTSPDLLLPEQRNRLEALLAAQRKKTAPAISILEGNEFVFSNLSYLGCTLPSVQLLPLLDNNASKTHDQWRAYAAENNSSIPNSVLWYQMLRHLYRVRNESHAAADSLTAALRSEFDQYWLHTGTKISYGSGLDARIDHLELDGSSRKVALDIPAFTRHDDNWSYLVLAPQQPVSSLGNASPIPRNAEPILDAFFGAGYAEAGTVFQYAASRKDNGQTLREVRLWVPTTRNTERCLVLGVYYGSDGFYVDAGVLSYVVRARGVVASS
ncbi:MAG: hypothetical protein Q8R53_04850, partial [Nanoarchaeota archaeon]|nr:hypothetical protein [Nanoarchaeota archaeon]